MKLAFSIAGLSIAAGYDAEQARSASIERAARKQIVAELRALEIEERAAQIRLDNEKRRAEIAARVEAIRAEMAQPVK